MSAYFKTNSQEMIHSLSAIDSIETDIENLITSGLSELRNILPTLKRRLGSSSDAYKNYKQYVYFWFSNTGSASIIRQDRQIWF